MNKWIAVDKDHVDGGLTGTIMDLHGVGNWTTSGDDCLDITEKTLTLLADLAGGYSSGKLLLKLEAVHLVLANHTSAEFPFLDVAANSRLRTTFYCTLCKLLFSDDQAGPFKAFMKPFTELMTQLREQSSPTAVPPDSARDAYATCTCTCTRGAWDRRTRTAITDLWTRRACLSTWTATELDP